MNCVTLDHYQLDGSFSRLAGYQSPDGTSLWTRHGFSITRCAIFECFFVCQKRIQQYLAKRKVKIEVESMCNQNIIQNFLIQIERGLRLYEQHNQNAAVKMWRSALKSTSKRNDKFQLLGYLYQGHMDWGKYRYNCTIPLIINGSRNYSVLRLERHWNMVTDN